MGVFVNYSTWVLFLSGNIQYGSSRSLGAETIMSLLTKPETYPTGAFNEGY